ncbi:MAG TPA: hypothetical protein VIX12_09680 [Candidatus Binataceae bacterium]
MNCWFCGREIETQERIGFRDHCPGCDRAVHACRNCEFYDPAYNNQCRENMAERVVDKERANFCDYFAPARTARGTGADSPSAAAQSKLAELFRKKK